MSLFRPRLLLAAALLSLPLIRTRACNPDSGEDSVLFRADKDLLAAPPGDFLAEIARLAPAYDPGLKAVVPEPSWKLATVADYGEQQTDAVDIADVMAALTRARVPEARRKDLALTLTAWRSALRAGKLAPLPAGLPEEFAAYERGAIAYHAKDLAGAREQWSALLALPDTQRYFRSVWATYMLGRTYSSADPARAAGLFEQTRALVKLGFADSLGLAVAALGWEGRARWQLGQSDRAFELFLEQAHAGDPTAPWSLRDCATELFARDDRQLARAAENFVTRQIVTAYLITRGGPDWWTPQDEQFKRRAQRWLPAVAAARIEDLRGADRLAWLTYQAGDMAAADRWLTVGGKEGEGTAVGHWIRAKLCLRAGQVDKAAAALAQAAAAFPKNEEWNNALSQYNSEAVWKPGERVGGELAMLKLGRAQFVEALDLLFCNDFWQDCAYIAEDVLTADELKGYVDNNWPAGKKMKAVKKRDSEGPPAKPFASPEQLRSLLARRLTRLGRWKEARPYFDQDVQPLLDSYVSAIRVGNDAKAPRPERALALWEAAKIARYHGMDLLGTELAPDWAVMSGAYYSTGDSPSRMAAATQPDHSLSPVSAEEQARIAAPPAAPNLRYHYRYTACEHAWAAAQLLPNESETLARILVEAGTWLKARDPKAADKFYKALVTRCGTTALGKQAAQLKWFPPLKDATKE